MLERTLILMRHAKSDWSCPGLHDHDRPLNQRGRQAAPLMGRYVAELSLEIETLLASSACRVQETIELMQTTWTGARVSVTTSRTLYLATPSVILSQIAEVEQGVANLMVVGHNPGMEDLASRLAKAEIEFPTACVAVFQSNAESWARAVQDARWTLQSVRRPRDLTS